MAETINALSSFRVYVTTANAEFLFFFTFTTRSLYMIYKATFSCSLTTNDYKCKQLIQDKIVTASQTGIFHFPESPLLKKQQLLLVTSFWRSRHTVNKNSSQESHFSFFILWGEVLNYPNKGLKEGIVISTETFMKLLLLIVSVWELLDTPSKKQPFSTKADVVYS